MLTITKTMWSTVTDEDPEFINRLKRRLTLLSADGNDLIKLYREVEDPRSLEIQTGSIDKLVLPYVKFTSIVDNRKVIDIDVAETMKKVKQAYLEMAEASPGFDVREHQLAGTLKCLINKHGICEAATGCFIGKTIILTNTGFETIQDLSFDYQGKQVYCSDGKFHNIVSAHITKQVKDTLKITFNDGVSVECTPEHPFLLTNGQYCQAINLLPEYPIAGVYGCRFVKSIFAEHYIEPVFVYDIEVDCDLHNFAISNGVIVHNSGKTEIISSLFKLIDGKILVINNRTNILNQIEGRARLRGITRKIEYLNKNPVLDNSDIIVSTNNLVWNMVKRRDPKIMRYLNEVKAIICDECFVGSTKVLTEQGYQQIKDIKVGTKVWTYNEETNQQELQVVENLIEKPLLKNLVKVTVDGKAFTCTEDHKIYTKEGWKEAKFLTEEDELLSYDTNLVKVSCVVSLKQSNKEVYDLTVSSNHNYFVEGFLVHNCHHGSCQSIAMPAMIADPEYLIGFTASPYKDGGQCVDDIVLNAVFGNSIYYISSKYLRDKGYSSKVFAYYINYAPKSKTFCRTCADVYKHYVAESFNRNEAAYRCIEQCYNNGLKILVMVSRLEHGKSIIREMKSKGIKSLFMCGNNTIFEATDKIEKTRKGYSQNVVVERKGNANDIKRAIREEGYRVIVGNVVFNEGIDVPEFDVGVLMDAGKNIISHIQRIGRVTRRKETGLNYSVFVDFNDIGHPYIETWTRERKKHLEDEGIPIINKEQFDVLIHKIGKSRVK